jgi:hypothetical protein
LYFHLFLLCQPKMPICLCWHWMHHIAFGLHFVAFLSSFPVATQH